MKRRNKYLTILSIEARHRPLLATRGEPMPGPSPICSFVLRGVN